MDHPDHRLAALLALPARAPDVAFVNEVALRVAAERTLAARIAADRAQTATLVAATGAVAAGLWLFAQGSAFATATATAAGGSGLAGLAALAAVMGLWLVTGGAGALSSE